MNLVGRLKYAAAELHAHYDDPVWVRNRVAQRLARPIHRYYPGAGDAIDVMAADGDSRADVDEGVHAVTGETDEVVEQRLRDLGYT